MYHDCSRKIECKAVSVILPAGLSGQDESGIVMLVYRDTVPGQAVFMVKYKSRTSRIRSIYHIPNTHFTMKFLSITFAIIAASSSVLAGVIGVSDQLDVLNENVAAAEPISDLPSKAVRCGGAYTPFKKGEVETNNPQETSHEKKSSTRNK